MKKVFLTFLGLLTVATLGGAVYYYISSTKSASAPEADVQSFPSDAGADLTTQGGTPDETSGTSTETQIGMNQKGEASAPTDTTPAPVYLRKISIGPIAPSASVFGKVKDNSLVVRYVGKEDGRVYEYRPQNPPNAQTARLTITTIPETQESYFSGTGTHLLLRYFDQNHVLKNYLATLPAPASTTPQEKTLTGSFVNKTLVSIATGPADSYAYVEETIDGGARVASGLFATTDKTANILPIREWQVSYPKTGTLVLTSSPSNSARGFSYSVASNGNNATLGGLQRLVGDISGLTILSSRDFSKMLYTGTRSESFRSYLLDIKTNKARDFPLATLPEKCVWDTLSSSRLYCASPEGIAPSAYPDSWYKGQTSFSDLLWAVNTESDATGILSVPARDAGTSMDITALAIAPDGSYLVFINKTDGSLWGFDLDLLRKNVF